jgi:signal recognition particle subunit SRP54
MREVTGVPIKYLGMGEKTSALELYHPDRLASRILGMGDLLSLIERAETSMDQERTEALGKRLIKGEFDLEDFLSQLREVRKMGPLSQLLEMVPGASRLSGEISPDLTDREMKRVEAIISSMTRQERRFPQIINASRKRRISRGSGTTVQEVNQLLSQFRQMQRMMKQLGGAGRRGRRKGQGLPSLLGGLGG